VRSQPPAEDKHFPSPYVFCLVALEKWQDVDSPSMLAAAPNVTAWSASSQIVFSSSMEISNYHLRGLYWAMHLQPTSEPNKNGSCELADHVERIVPLRRLRLADHAIDLTLRGD
jgi:hypothetical protein